MGRQAGRWIDSYSCGCSGESLARAKPQWPYLGNNVSRISRIHRAHAFPSVRPKLSRARERERKRRARVVFPRAIRPVTRTHTLTHGVAYVYKHVDGVAGVSTRYRPVSRPLAPRFGRSHACMLVLACVSHCRRTQPVRVSSRDRAGPFSTLVAPRILRSTRAIRLRGPIFRVISHGNIAAA